MRCDWSSLVSPGIASGHVSPALSERELVSHQICFCFYRLAPIIFSEILVPEKLCFYWSVC